jgi:hypothetical protein
MLMRASPAATETMPEGVESSIRGRSARTQMGPRDHNGDGVLGVAVAGGVQVMNRGGLGSNNTTHAR